MRNLHSPTAELMIFLLRLMSWALYSIIRSCYAYLEEAWPFHQSPLGPVSFCSMQSASTAL